MHTAKFAALTLGTILALATLPAGCGSQGGGSSGGSEENPGNPTDLTGGNGNPLNCAKAWSQYVASNPKGLKLTYETTGMGYQSTSTQEVLESSDALVTVRYTSNGKDSDFSTTRDEFVKGCSNTSTVPPDDDSQNNTVVEERRKESKAVRAGTFATDYIRIRHNRVGGQEDGSMVSESWTMADSSHSLVYQRNTSTFSGQTMETVMELVEIRRP